MPSIPPAADRDYAPAFGKFGVVLGPPNQSGEAVAEACFSCGKPKLYVNVRTGLYHCKVCSARGNITTFLTAACRRLADSTADDQYRALKARRGIPLQTLKAYGLGYDPAGRRWAVPFRSKEGNVLNVQFYHPDLPAKPNKFNLPGLPTCLFGMDRLSDDADRVLFLCEGPFDAMALHYNLGWKHRGRYDVLATPGAFSEKWADVFRGRKVRALFDNDAGGEQHRQTVRRVLGEGRVAADLLLLTWPEKYRVGGREVTFPAGCDVNDLVRDDAYAGISIPAFSLEHGVRATGSPVLLVSHGRRPVSAERPIDWVWPSRLRCGTYVSFSGRQGTFKSTVMQELAARYTTGRPMPLCPTVGLPAGHVLYVHAEDDRDAAEGGFERAGGDLSKWHCMPAVGAGGEAINLLEHLDELRAVVREFGIRLVVIDGQNSVVGAPNISTDMLARTNVTNKLHQFAQRENVCLVGVRNEDAEGRALGPQSFGDIGRCVVRAVETDPRGVPPYCVLKFVKVSDAPREEYPDVPYSVENRGGVREVLWGKERPKPGTAAGKSPGEILRDRLRRSGVNGVPEKPPPKNHP